MKFGIMGLGKIADKFAQTVRDYETGAVIAAVASNSAERSEGFAREYGITNHFGSYAEMLDFGDFDAVYISATNEKHYDCCLSSIKAGKHVLCEKPLVLSPQEARDLKEAAAQSGVFLMEAIWTRFLPAHEKAIEWALGGKIGELRGVSSSFCLSSEFDPNSRKFSTALGGGAVYDIGIYCLQLTRLLTRGRELKDVKTIVIPLGTGVDMTSSALMLYEGDFVADFRCSFNTRSPNEAYILGKSGYIRISQFFHHTQRVELYTSPTAVDNHSPKPDDVFVYETASGFEFQIRHFVECVAKGLAESPVMPPDDSIWLAEMMERVIR